MAPNGGYKKPQRKTEEYLEPRKTRHGKQPHQRMKPYLIMEYLMRMTDEDSIEYEGEDKHIQSAYDIADYLEDTFGITADRRSKVNWLVYVKVLADGRKMLLISGKRLVGSPKSLLRQKETLELIPYQYA